jgi:hypothetical protein
VRWSPRIAAIAVCVGGAIAVSGCGGPGPSSCAPPVSSPTTLSGDDRRDPVVASDGGGGVVAVWESLTGGPVEAAARTATGSWSTATALSAPFGRAPSIGVSPDGSAVATWQIPMSRQTTAVQVADRNPIGGWTAPREVSAPRTHAREPQIGITGDRTTIVVWRRDTASGDTVIEVVERPPGGVWTPPTALSNPAVRSSRPRLAVAPNGAAALVWEQRDDDDVRAMASTRTLDGRWSAPAVLSRDGSAHEPDVGIGPTGAATAAWIEERGDRAAAVTASHPDLQADAWSAPAVVGEGSGLPRETSRPGRADTGADVAVSPDGRVAAAWTIVDADGLNRVEVATRGVDGAWTAPTALSKPGRTASGVHVAPLAGGSTIAAWEEIDGGLLGARVTRIEPTGITGCTDLTRALTETAAVRLVGGTAPTAVFVDFNRSRVQAIDL